MKASYVIMGVSGSGKSTIGSLWAQETGLPFMDADDYHPKANVDKMSAGIPLTDADRWPWLEKLANVIREQESGCVLACSALKFAYRDALAQNNELVFIYIDAPEDLILERMKTRKHFMPPSLLRSQFETLEIPDEAVRVDGTLTPEEIVGFLSGEFLAG